MQADDTIYLDRWVNDRDPDAFCVIVSRYASMVFATGRRVVGNAADAEDIAQECFQKLAMIDHSPPTFLGPWLHRVATNIALNKRRGELRMRAREATFVDKQAAATEPVWDDIFEYVDEALAELPDELRLPLVAHYLEGRSHSNIAEQSGIPRKTVTNRIHKGVEETRRHLARRGIAVGGTALVAMMTANLSEAATVPASLMANLGKVALSGVSGASPISTSSFMVSAGTIKTVAAAAAAVCFVAIGLFSVSGEPSEPQLVSEPQPAVTNVPTSAPEPALTPVRSAAAPAADTVNANPVQGVPGTVREILAKYQEHQKRIERITFRYEAGTNETWQYPPNFPESRVNGTFTRGETGEVSYDGRRLYMHTCRWGGTKAFGYIDPTNPAHRICIYDGKQDIQWDGANSPSNRGLGSIGKGAPIGETIQQAPSHGRYYGVWGMYLGPEAMGFVLQEGRRVDEILREASDSRLRIVPHGGIEYAVIDAETPYGTFSVTFDPIHDYNVSHYSIRKREGHLLRKDNSRAGIMEGVVNEEDYRVSKFVEVNGLWVVEAFEHQLRMKNLDLGCQSQIDKTFVRTQIELDPDFDALGTFTLMRDVPDGSEWTYRMYPGYRLKDEDYLVWQAGQLVPRGSR